MCVFKLLGFGVSGSGNEVGPRDQDSGCCVLGLGFGV